MGEVAMNHTIYNELVPSDMQNTAMKDSEVEAKVYQPKEEKNVGELLDRGVMQYGCPHYHRRCRIRAPCCNEVFDYRHCHNEAKNDINVDQKHRHDMPRQQLWQVICLLCGIEQDVR